MKDDLAKVTAVIVHIGVGKNDREKEQLHRVIEDVRRVTGQQPALRRAKRAIAGFKVREGETVGVQVTLHGRRMNAFISKLVHVVFPQLHDFQGIQPSSFDSQGNLNIGIPENSVFPELRESVTAHGLGITLRTTTEDRETAMEMLRKKYGFPFVKERVVHG